MTRTPCCECYLALLKSRTRCHKPLEVFRVILCMRDHAPCFGRSKVAVISVHNGIHSEKLASTPGPTEFVGPGSRCLILHGWSLGNAIAQKHHYDNAHKQLTVCCRSQELLLSTTSSCQHLFQMLGSLHGDGTDSAR